MHTLQTRRACTAYSHRVHRSCPPWHHLATTSQVETEVADDAFLLALQAAEQQAERQAGGRGGNEGSGAGGASRGGLGGGVGDGGGRHREARPRSAAAAEGGGWCGDGGSGGLGAPSALPEHPKRRKRASEIHATDETHGAPPVDRQVDMRPHLP